jgi:hypothetical protein
MATPGPTELLDTWEAGSAGNATARATALLRLADGCFSEADALEVDVGARDAALLRLHRSLFGPTLAGVTSCPACADELELALDAGELASSYVPAEPVEAAGLVARLPTGRDLSAAGRAATVAEARTLLAARSTGAELDDDAVAAVSSALGETAGPADALVALRCPSCGHEWEAPLDVAAFVWIEVDAAARATLLEVDALARAYGWTEREVLELPRARRRGYLELVES